jgi:hypothetical protein
VVLVPVKGEVLVNGRAKVLKAYNGLDQGAKVTVVKIGAFDGKNTPGFRHPEADTAKNDRKSCENYMAASLRHHPGP